MHLRSVEKLEASTMGRGPTQFPPRRIPPLHIALGGLALSVVVNIALAIHVVSAVKQRDGNITRMLAAIEAMKNPSPSPDYTDSFKAARDSLAAIADHQRQVIKALNDLTVEQGKFGEKLDKGRRR